MNSSLWSADGTTHIKIVVISLIAAIVVAAVGINAHVSDPRQAAAPIKSDGAIVKARRSDFASDRVSPIR